MTTQSFPPLCSSCARRDYTKGNACEAFPEQGAIPDGIFLDLGDHRAPWPGDHGLRYVMVEGGEADLKAWELARSLSGGPKAAAGGSEDVTSSYQGEPPTLADFSEEEQVELLKLQGS